jgi:hypothetical protein
LFDTCFDDEPPPAPPVARLRPARRLWRRRRAVAGLATACAAAAAVAALVTVSGSGTATVATELAAPGRPASDPATNPATNPASGVSSDPTPADGGVSSSPGPGAIADCLAVIDGLIDLDPEQLDELDLT